MFLRISIAGAMLLMSGPAAAQITITQAIPSDTREIQPNTISRADCQETKLEVTFTGLAADETVSVWVSETADCSLAASRESGGACVDVGIAFSGSVNPNAVETFALGELVGALPDVTDCVDETERDQGRELGVFFLVDAAPGADSTNFTTLSRYDRIDLVGPPPPTLASATPVEDGLSLDFSDSSPSGAGYDVFVEPAQSGCTGASLRAGEIPPSMLARARGTMSPLEARLDADTRYVVGLAAVDSIGNAGPLSNVLCAKPLAFAPLSGGSGGCNVMPQGRDVWWPLLLLLGLQFRSRAKSLRSS